MTPVQIAYFKHFLFDMGLQAVYISKYRRSRLRGDPGKGDEENPESLEEFLQQQPHYNKQCLQNNYDIYIIYSYTNYLHKL